MIGMTGDYRDLFLLSDNGFLLWQMSSLFKDRITDLPKMGSAQFRFDRRNPPLKGQRFVLLVGDSRTAREPNGNRLVTGHARGPT